MNDVDPRSKYDGSEPSAREAYNLVTDTVTGVNIRKWDNVIQAIVSAICLVLGIGTGWLVAVSNGWGQLEGVLLGAFLGLLAGLLGSGIFLMIFRAVRHIRGKHD